MRRNQKRVRMRLQHDFQQITAVKPEDRTAVRLDVSNLGKLRRKTRCSREAGHENDIVNLSGLVVLFIDAADLNRQHEPNVAATRGRECLFKRPGVFVSKFVEPGFRFLQLLFKNREPLWMREVCSADHSDALQLRPIIQILQIEILARGSRITAVQMNVGDEQGRRRGVMV